MTLVGCETLPRRDPVFTPVQPVDLRLPPQTNGSIYQAGYDMRLFEDLTAKRVGDILTVKLKESTQAKKNSDLDVEKDDSISVTAPILSGIDPSFIFDKNLSATLESTHKFEGEGEANQSNELSGDITVTVVEVYPNGNLKIRGEKRVTLNDGSEYIRLSGIVRPIDIDESNVILSTKVADATIMYTGDGSVADASKMGWFARFFHSPVFPF
jgi:flagellar L-ring protein precursor FlgH